jgi:hypothetical protein
MDAGVRFAAAAPVPVPATPQDPTSAPVTSTPPAGERDARPSDSELSEEERAARRERFQSMTPEERAAERRKRMESMTPEQREEAMRRMRERQEGRGGGSEGGP